MVVSKGVWGEMHMHVFETCEHFSFSGGSEGNCKVRICWSPYGKRNKLRNKLMPKHQDLCLSTTLSVSVPCHEIVLMSLCHGQKKCLSEKEASWREEEKTIFHLICCQNEVSSALFWLEWETLYKTVLKGGPSVSIVNSGICRDS